VSSPGRQVQVALAVELDLAADVAAQTAVGRHAQDLLLGREVQPGAGRAAGADVAVAVAGVPAGTPPLINLKRDSWRYAVSGLAANWASRARSSGVVSVSGASPSFDAGAGDVDRGVETR
jgi:hypothetical protein